MNQNKKVGGTTRKFPKWMSRSHGQGENQRAPRGTLVGVMCEQTHVALDRKWQQGDMFPYRSRA